MNNHSHRKVKNSSKHLKRDAKDAWKQVGRARLKVIKRVFEIFERYFECESEKEKKQSSF